MKAKLITLGVLTLVLGIGSGIALVDNDTEATIIPDENGVATFQVQLPETDETGTNIKLSINEISKMDATRQEKFDRLMESMSGEYVNTYQANDYYAYVIRAYNAEEYLDRPDHDQYMLSQIMYARLAHQFYNEAEGYEYIARFLEHYDKLMTGVYLRTAGDDLIATEKTKMMEIRWALDEKK